LAVGKLRTHASPGVSSLAKELVKAWKEVVEENKRKRKRDDGEVKTEDGKRVKAEGESARACTCRTMLCSAKRVASDEHYRVFCGCISRGNIHSRWEG
jgi:transcription elongation factor S-II